MTHYEQSLTQDGKPITYQWIVLEPCKPAPGCDEAFRVVAECTSERDAKRVSESLNHREEYERRNLIAYTQDGR